MPTYQRFPLPDAGEGLTEADIVEWRVAVGDTVAVNQTIVEIETAKSLVELPSPFEGVVTEILVPAGRTANVGDPIIVIDVDPGGPAAAAPDDAVAAAPAEGAETAGEAAAGDVLGVDQPAGGTGSGAVLVGYGVSDGGTRRRPRRAAPSSAPPAVAPAADRAASAAPPAGRAASANPPAGRAASANPPAGRAASAGERVETGGGFDTGPAALLNQRTSGDERVLAKPPVRKLARDLGIDLASVVPSGPGGIITREDVLAYQEQGEARELVSYPSDEDSPWLADGKVSADGRQTRVPVRSVRRRTAEAVAASAFTAPHVTLFHTVDVTRTMRLVARLKESKEFAGVRVTPLLVVMKALLIAVDRHPEINASWDDEAQEIVYKHYVNLGIAAATPRGLVVPNIKDAHRMGMLELAQALGELTSRARAGKTSPREMADGTISITNVGVFGVDSGTPILNPGEAAILAFGAIREQPWVHKGKIKKRWITQLALSFDHRLVDGDLGARVTADLAAVLEEPANGLVWG